MVMGCFSIVPAGDTVSSTHVAFTAQVGMSYSQVKVEGGTPEVSGSIGY